uniref:NADH-ubiquinone oxidoreductase chain 3 n=1 Tax=Wickerhamomyces canadensis TaxID=1156965 RepID=NU3M_WICCA|nr:NADH dehydrogenase subunit 3 [Wickerhamomyces canadensis]P48913.2 RecName: Full=NADH-ubiquinone oxidoreductase chain 3; AltName: Full=NADH dehydrogenase subunit 3 [Wickerhamomyces canadensis]BAA06574.2 NADH dehydrogenase subunit 3 [Wickerhamomyces canadensis]
MLNYFVYPYGIENDIGIKFYMILVPIISIVLIIINYIITNKSDNNINKTGPYECGFDSFRQSRTTYSIKFILIAILFLPFDLELTSILPYTLSIYNLNIYGLFILLYFLLPLIIGFIIEINLKAIYITKIFNRNVKSITSYVKYNNKI